MRRFTYRHGRQLGAGLIPSKLFSSKEDDTPLTAAVRARDIDAVDRICNAELVNKPNNVGNTPLHIAVERGWTLGIIYLLRQGANPNLPNNANETPFHIAARGGSLQIIQYLLEAGASLGPKNNEDRNALNIAKHHDRTNILHLFPKNPVPAGIQTFISPSSAANRALIPDGIFDRIIDVARFNNTAQFVNSTPDICTAIDDDYMRDALYGSDFIVTLRTADNVLLGFAALNLRATTLHVELFCTHYRYRGLGVLLMNKVKELHTAVGKNIMNLNSVPSAREFYRKQGFVENANNHRNDLRHMTYRRTGGGRRGLKSRVRTLRKWRL
jgi:hypothetical protein